MIRLMTTAALAGALAGAAMAAPQNQLVAPNFNPALKTVPYAPQSQSARPASCETATETKAQPIVAAKDEPNAAKGATAETASQPGATPKDACPQTDAQAATATPLPIAPQP
jgi:hypothetical protein